MIAVPFRPMLLDTIVVLVGESTTSRIAPSVMWR